MTIMRIAPAKAQALPSTLDERLAKIRKASLTTQKKSRDPACCSTFFRVSTVIIVGGSRNLKAALIRGAQGTAEPHIRRPAVHSPIDGKSSRARNRSQARERLPSRGSRER